MRHALIWLVGFAAMLAGAPDVHADEMEFRRPTTVDVVSSGDKQVAPPAERPVVLTAAKPSRWTFGLESTYSFLDVPNVLLAWKDRDITNPLHYRVATQILSARYQLTNPHGPWLLRGVLEVSANVVGSIIVHGPENYFIGFAPGFRYYFIQPGARLKPYVEVRGGPGQTDSRGFHYAQQQDLCFTYMFGAGVLYDVDTRWSLTVSVLDQHISNAYLTNPNYGFDAVGISIGFIRPF